MRKETRISYIFIFLMILLAGWLHLSTLLLSVFFSYFALTKLPFQKSRWLSVVLFTAMVLAIFYGFAFFIRQAFIALPNMISTALPLIVKYAGQYGIELPFTDVESLKALVIDSVKDQLRSFWNFARIETKEFIVLAIGAVIAACLFLNPVIDLDRGRHLIRNNLFSVYTEEIAARFRALYHSFAVVMGAQLLISAINTGLTSLFILACNLPYPQVIIVVTFLCGLLPIIGNLISNTIIVGISLTISLRLGVSALIFLVVLHKLEYFLNSKIIGDRIKNPVWLTLLGLVIGERLLGLPGMILAPVFLNYIRVEASQIPVAEPTHEAQPPTGRA